MNAQILIQSVVQQTMVFIAQLATAGGVRAPLATLANQVFLDLSDELQSQGIRKSVIADMFGMTLRTYHRKVRELSQSRSVEGRTVWEAVLEFLREREPISGNAVYQRFTRDERDVIASVLNDLVNSGLVYRAGRGGSAVYRVADAADFLDQDPSTLVAANEYLVWQAIYRSGPLNRTQLEALTHLDPSACQAALERLAEAERIKRHTHEGQAPTFTSDRLDVPVGQEQGWEAAVFDHYQAMVAAISAKLTGGAGRAERRDVIGGATYSLDVRPGHPLEGEVLGTLARVRAQLEDLRARVDLANAGSEGHTRTRVVFYMGQYVKEEESREAHQGEQT